MPLVVSGYSDPGILIGEVVSPNAVNIATTPMQLGIIGIGSRLKTVTNQAVQRGLVEAEALTLVNTSGSITSISAPVSGVQTLTDSTAAFPTSIIGQPAAITNATAAVNNGVFIVLDRPTATTFTYANAAGVIQAGAVGTYAIQPHAVLANRADRALQNTTVFKNGIAQSDTFLAFQPAFVQGTETTDRDLSSAANRAFVLEMDGHTPITINIVATAAATSIAVIGGTQFNLTLATAAQPAFTPITLAELVAGINAVLVHASASALGYGVTYAGAARIALGGIRIVSPVGSPVAGGTSGPTSDVRVSAAIANDLNDTAASRIFATSVVDAATALGVSRMIYSATATFLADYINTASNADALVASGLQEITRVGSFAGVGNFESGVDYLLSGQTISWGGTGAAPDTPPVYPSTGVAGTAQTFDLSTNDRLQLAFDGRASLNIDLNALASPPLGYANPGTPAAATAAEVAANINAVVSNSSVYGPLYKSVASAQTIGAATFVQLTSPTDGESGQVQILIPATLSANTAVFGLTATQTVSVTGAGSRPALAALYFVTYTITRPTTDYAVQKRFFSLDNAQADLGNDPSTNALIRACEIAFENAAPSVVVVQVNDTSSEGSPTRAEFRAALDALKRNDVVTDVVLLTTDLAIQTDLKDHIEQEAGPTQKHYRRGWFGMARSTNIGDKDTADTYVYRARRTLQVAGDSPGRGRLILVAPPQLTGVSRDVTLPDGSTTTVSLDTTYLAVALAAKKSSFTSPATSLAKKTITSFNISDITADWSRPERGLLASQGCMVVTYDAGLFKVLDPVTTEAGGGAVPKFMYESISSQKDNVTRKMDQAMDANLIGVVPDEILDFLVDIKVIVKSVIEAEIGAKSIAPMNDGPNTPTRAFSLTKDVSAQISPNDPAKYFFKYGFNTRTPALRIWGEFATDAPGFATA